CPVCNAQLEDDLRECRRCKTDIGEVVDIKNRSIYHKQKAIEAFEKSSFHEMFFHARRSFTLFASPESAKMVACSALLINKFNLSYVMWKNSKTYENNTIEEL
ncbi:MAG: hypothetical protein HQK74_05035, partial [Desulfamplus sp.]|nr:hypothetical protein [Desulfamplus sp.]